MHAQNYINRRILVIDDNRAIHEDFRRILARPEDDLGPARAELFGDEPEGPMQEGFEVTSAFQGQEGLERVRESMHAGRPFAMAFVDIRMPPGWDGIETTARLWDVCPDLQIVICTAYSDYSWEEMIQRVGKSDRMVILKKPFDNIEVLQLAHTLCEKWSLLLQARAKVSDLELRVEERTSTLRHTNRQLEIEIEERKRAEEALRNSQAVVLRQERLAAIGQLSAGVAHDFNNIMTVIQGYAELILSARGCAPEWTAGLKEIMSAAGRASKLTQQLLAFSRQQIIRSRHVDLVEVVSNFGEMLTRVLGEDIQLGFHYEPGVHTIKADPTLLEQVVMNFAMNARDAMPNGGQLRVTVAAVQIGPAHVAKFPEALCGSFACLSIADTGCGMDEATLKRVFEPFFTTKDVGQGTGLGLATVYGIVKQHQGWLEVESEPGRGTTFRAYFPMVPAPPAQIEATSAKPNDLEAVRPTA